VGVAHRVESVLGSIEPEFLDSPSQVPAEIERFGTSDRGCSPRARGLRPESPPQEIGRLRGGKSSRATCRSSNDPALVSKVHDLIETRDLTALSALQAVMHNYAAQFGGGSSRITSASG